MLLRQPIVTLFPYTTLFRSGLDFHFMKAVAKIESGFDPKQRTGSYIGLFQLSEYEFSKFAQLEQADIRSSALDRKSTRLNSSHEWISYAVFCLKKKKKKKKK